MPVPVIFVGAAMAAWKVAAYSSAGAAVLGTGALAITLAKKKSSPDQVPDLRRMSETPTLTPEEAEDPQRRQAVQEMSKSDAYELLRPSYEALIKNSNQVVVAENGAIRAIQHSVDGHPIHVHRDENGRVSCTIPYCGFTADEDGYPLPGNHAFVVCARGHTTCKDCDFQGMLDCVYTRYTGQMHRFKSMHIHNEPNIGTFWNEHVTNVRESRLRNGGRVPSRSPENRVPTRYGEHRIQGYRNECPACRSNFIMSKDGSPRVAVEVPLEGLEDNSTKVAGNARWDSSNA